MTYAFAEDKPERLTGLEITWDPGTIAHLESIGVGAGWRCLEVGAGGGSIARWLADRVGVDGRVLAIDIDISHVAGLAGGQLEVRELDLLHDDLPAASFDLVHARLLLEWLGDSGALERMVAALAPAGWLLIEDFDWGVGGLMTDTLPDRAKAYEAILDLLAGIGYQAFCGRTLLGQLERAGLQATGTASRSYLLHGGSPGTAFDRFSFLAHRDRLVDSGRLTAEEFDAAVAEMGDPARYVLTPLMWAAWGRKAP